MHSPRRLESIVQDEVCKCQRMLVRVGSVVTSQGHSRGACSKTTDWGMTGQGEEKQDRIGYGLKGEGAQLGLGRRILMRMARILCSFTPARTAATYTCMQARTWLLANEVQKLRIGDALLPNATDKVIFLYAVISSVRVLAAGTAAKELGVSATGRVRLRRRSSEGGLHLLDLGG